MKRNLLTSGLALALGFGLVACSEAPTAEPAVEPTAEVVVPTAEPTAEVIVPAEAITPTEGMSVTDLITDSTSGSEFDRAVMTMTEGMTPTETVTGSYTTP